MALAVNSAIERDTNDSCGEFLRDAKCMAGSASGAVYVVSASGKNLGGAPPFGAKFEASLRKRLAEYRELDPKERSTETVKITELDNLDPIRQAHQLPPDALAVRVSNRPMEPDISSDTGYRYVVAEDYPVRAFGSRIRFDWERYAQPADDFLWLKEDEWKSLIPDNPEVGQNVPIPDDVEKRIFRFHLVPSRGLGERGGWNRNHVLDSQLDLTVEDVSDDKIVLRLEGFANFKSIYRKKDDPLIYDPYLYGKLEIDRKKETFTRFDILAFGDVTGSPNGENQLGRRLGAHPLAVAFQLIDPEKTPAMSLHPRGLRDHPAVYWKPDTPHGG